MIYSLFTQVFQTKMLHILASVTVIMLMRIVVGSPTIYSGQAFHSKFCGPNPYSSHCISSGETWCQISFGPSCPRDLSHSPSKLSTSSKILWSALLASRKSQPKCLHDVQSTICLQALKYGVTAFINWHLPV
jgi:hypothetical protein